MTDQNRTTPFQRKSVRLLNKHTENDQLTMSQQEKMNISMAGDSNESEEPATKKMKTGDQQCDDEVFVRIEDIEDEPNEPAKPISVATAVATSNGLELAQIPIGINRQVVPVQARLLDLEEHFQTNGNKGSTKSKTFTIMKAKFGDLEGREVAITFWNEQVWKFLATLPKVYGLYTICDMEIEATDLNDKYNSGNLPFVGNVNINCKTLTKHVKPIEINKLTFIKVNQLDPSFSTKTVNLKGTLGECFNQNGETFVYLYQKIEGNLTKIKVILNKELAELDHPKGTNVSILGAQVKLTGWNHTTKKAVCDLITLPHSKIDII